MNPGRDAVILVIVLLALGVAAFSIKTTPSSFSLLTHNTALPKAKKSYEYSSPRTSEKKVDEEKSARQIERQIEDIQAEVALIEKKLEEIEKYGDESKYKGMVTIRKSSSGPRADDVDKEHIQLDVSSKLERSINISNWKLQSSVTGRNIKVGEAVTLFFSGDSNPETPLRVLPGNKVYVITGRSPIGESFQVNTCSGYFNQFQSFHPRISSKCPDPEDEILSYTRDTSIFIEDACMDFVERIPRCKIQTSTLPLNLSFACQDAILEEINYNSCVAKHKDDAGFYGGIWYVYSKRGQELWKEKREIILLLDENGKTVDHYSY